METTADDMAYWRAYREQWPGVFRVDEGYVRLRRLVPRDGSCTCRAQWRINVAGGLGLAGWHCPEHGTVLPDREGNPRQEETVETRRVAAERAEREARTEPRRKHRERRQEIATQMRLGLDA